MTYPGVPGYATACKGSDRFSSACSCIGVTGITITAPAPSTTVTVTATVTEEPIVAQGSIQPILRYARAETDVCPTAPDAAISHLPPSLCVRTGGGAIGQLHLRGLRPANSCAGSTPEEQASRCRFLLYHDASCTNIAETYTTFEDTCVPLNGMMAMALQCHCQQKL